MNRNYTAKLVFINIVIFGIVYLFCPYFVYSLGLSPSWIEYRNAFWQLLTYFFIHGSISHLFFNMLSLYIFGSAVEQRIGSKDFLIFYILCGTLSGLMSLVFYKLINVNVLLIGSSGAIYGLLFLFSCFYPRSNIYLFGVFPIKAPVLIAMYFFVEMISQFSYDGISHLTHCFGLGVGFCYYYIKYKENPFNVWKRGY